MLQIIILTKELLFRQCNYDNQDEFIYQLTKFRRRNLHCWIFAVFCLFSGFVFYPIFWKILDKIFLWDKQRKKSGALYVCSILHHPTFNTGAFSVSLLG